MDDIGRTVLLVDFYGQLLTPRQLEIMEMRYNNDLALSEIADQCGITRQAVYDNIRKSSAVLEGYEKKLNLAGRHMEYRTRIASELKELLDITIEAKVKTGLCLHKEDSAKSKSAVDIIDRAIEKIEGLLAIYADI